MYITINDKKYELKLTFKNIAAIEEGLGMGILAYIVNRIQKSDSRYDLPSKHVFVIIHNAASQQIEKEELENYIAENFLDSLNLSVSVLNSIFTNGENQDENDEKKN